MNLLILTTGICGHARVLRHGAYLWGIFRGWWQNKTVWQSYPRYLSQDFQVYWRSPDKPPLLVSAILTLSISCHFRFKFDSWQRMDTRSRMAETGPFYICQKISTKYIYSKGPTHCQTWASTQFFPLFQLAIICSWKKMKSLWQKFRGGTDKVWVSDVPHGRVMSRVWRLWTVRPSSVRERTKLCGSWQKLEGGRQIISVRYAT